MSKVDVSTSHGCAALCTEITDYWHQRGLKDAVAAPVQGGFRKGHYCFEVECNVRLVKASDGWAAVTE